ncbi:pyrokinin-1 receptor-like [Pectinophora gossypiella]|uniref:pyrokinin-1 receptor-like n=1 Tax=Pectinophora gossypiella TaxID=13191 RepID=UPI00214F25B9|nr:pyrokinin-1 receptor-like [Pectinophora gossypiella]XP_049868570.1 pyrokinin-1 receptor-like [Pectinophora gossypiella]
MFTLGNETNITDNFSMSAVDPTDIFGPQRDSLYIVLPITIIYTLIFITGLFGNIFTCIVIIRNKSMHTATNYYLFSLAISDLLLLVSGMPQEMYSIWSKWPYVFGHTFCLIRGLAAETSTNASVLTITLFTVERYLAICHPFVSHKMSKLSRAMKHVMLLWVVSFGLALPQALQFGIKDHQGVTMCLQTRVIIAHSFEISTFFFFFAPMILITVLYSLIGLRLKKTSISKQTKEKEDFERNMRFNHRIRRKHSQSTRRVVKMLVAVVVAFFICWAPFHAQRLVAIYGTAENHLARSPVLLFVYSTLTYISGIFYYMSTCINPIFYHIMSNKFREAFKNTMMHWCCREERRTLQRCSYTAIAFARHPNSNGTINSGNSTRNETPIHTKATRLDSKEQIINIDGQQFRVCDYCNRAMPTAGQMCRTHGCHHKYTVDFKNKRDHVDSNPRSDRSKPNFIEMSLVPEKRKFCGPSCCAAQESPSETPTPPTPDAATGSSEENRTQYYPVQSDKYTKEIKLRMKQR